MQLMMCRGDVGCGHAVKGPLRFGLVARTIISINPTKLSHHEVKATIMAR